MAGNSHTAEAGKDGARPWLFLVLWIASAILLQRGLSYWGRSVPEVIHWARGAQGFFVLRMTESLLGVGIILTLQRPDSVSALREIFFLQRPWTKTVLCWLCVGVVVGVLLQLVPAAWCPIGTAQGAVVRRTTTEGGIEYFVVALLLIPITEEAIMRAYLYQSFQRRIGRLLALAIIAAVTVLQHYSEIRGSVFSAYRYAGLGLLWCYAFDTKRNLMDSIACHIGYNLVVAVTVIRWVVTASR
jgi:membrane protease YdiL (CAAX protease family)